jgi:ABC-type Zn uptake system ZnuABC Zn-binding protein ZnuA
VELFVWDFITQTEEAEEQFAQFLEELENLKDESRTKLEEMKQI